MYFALAKLGLRFAFENAYATALWPCSGVALAALLFFGKRLWPGVFLGAFLVNFSVENLLLPTLGIAVGNTFEALAAAGLIERFFEDRRRLFDHNLDILKFTAITMSGASASAFVGVTSLALAGKVAQYGTTWITWWVGDVVSMLILVPLFLAWPAGKKTFRAFRVLDAVLLMIFLLLTGNYIFGIKSLPLTYLAILPVLWAAFRFGAFGSALVVLAMSVLAALGTIQGRGPYGHMAPNSALLFLQVFMGTIAVTGMLIASSVRARRRIEQALQIQYSVANLLVESVDLKDAAPKILSYLCSFMRWDCGALWIADADGNLVCADFWSAAKVRVEAFRAATLGLRFPPGQGVPGRVWASGEPVWIPDVAADKNFPRLPVALKEGLRGAIGFPILLNGQSIGVIEFFSRRIQSLDKELLAMVAATGNQIGQFIERRRVELELRRASELLAGEAFRLIVESVQDYAIFMLKPDGTIATWNAGAERTKGYKAEEVIGRHFSMFYELADREAGRPERSLRVASANGRYEEEGWRVRKGGIRFWAHVIMSAVRDKEGKLVGFSKVTRDITERKENEIKLKRLNDELEVKVKERTRELAESNRELEQFAYVASHDLQEPLRKIITFSDRLKERDVQGLGLVEKDYLDRMQSAAARMKTLIEDLLNFSRVTMTERSFETLDLKTVIQDVLSDLDLKINQMRARIDIGQLPVVVANPMQMRQLFLNLLGNAIKFAKEGRPPHIQVDGREVHSGYRLFYEITVTDNGIGFEEKYVDRIFKPFQRLHGRKEYEGTGIGLAICQKIMERHGGDITAKSRPGDGSTFILTFPAN